MKFEFPDFETCKNAEIEFQNMNFQTILGMIER